MAAALDCPSEFVDALSARKAPVIPLDLMAAAGMIFTYTETLRGEDIIFFIDDQSVCCALVQGCSRSCDIQLLSIAWQLMCIQTGCRIWIEWSPLNLTQRTYSPQKAPRFCLTRSGKVDTLMLPPWTNVSKTNIRNVFDTIGLMAGTMASPMRPDV